MAVGTLTQHLLTIVIFLPLVFAAMVAFLPSGEKGQIRAVALVGTVVSSLSSLWLYLAFDASPAAPEFQFVFKRVWIANLGVSYHVGVDGMAVSLMMLTGFLAPIVWLSTFSAIEHRVKELAIAILVLQTAMYGTFSSLDLALFYVFWETLLIPMYLLIGVWGSHNRIYAAVKFFLYTFAASVLMLVAILYLYVKTGTPDARSFDYQTMLSGLKAAQLSWPARQCLFLAFALAFAVKVPMFPLHTWLPDAHVEAPAAGSIVLAGVLLKMGVFGFLRYAMPFFPDAAAYFRPAIIVLAVVGIVYGSLMSFAQRDMKKLVAYSSVAHLGFVMLGVAALSVQATVGAIYQMLNHGVSTGALFLLIGILYERTHTRAIADYGGIAKVVPMIAATFLVITLSSIGLPGTNGFIGEFLILIGAYTAPFAAPSAGLPPGVAAGSINTMWVTAFASTGVVLGAVYMLLLYQRVMLGPVRHPENRRLKDLTGREWVAVLPLVLVAVLMGVLPQPFLDRIEPSARRFVERMAGPALVAQQAGGAPSPAVRPDQPSAAAAAPTRPMMLPDRMRRLLPSAPGGADFFQPAPGEAAVRPGGARPAPSAGAPPMRPGGDFFVPAPKPGQP